MFEALAFHLADNVAGHRDLSLTQILRVAQEDLEVSADTVRRTMADLVRAGQASVLIHGRKGRGETGRGLETVWEFHLDLAPLQQAFPVARNLTREGRLAGRQKGAKNRQTAQAAIAQWEAMAGTKAALIRGSNSQPASLQGVFPSSVPSGEIPKTSHSIVEAPLRAPARGNRGMGKGAESREEQGGDPQFKDLTAHLVQNLGADPGGAALRGLLPQAEADLRKLESDLSDGLSRLTPDLVPELAKEVGGSVPVLQPMAFLIATLKSNPRRVQRGLKRFLKHLDARIATQEAALGQSGFSRHQVQALPAILRDAFTAWALAKGRLPLPNSAGYLEALDQERDAYSSLVQRAEKGLEPERTAALQGEVRSRLLAAGIPEDGLVWRRAWAHHWGQAVTRIWGLEQVLSIDPEDSMPAIRRLSASPENLVGDV